MNEKKRFILFKFLFTFIRPITLINCYNSQYENEENNFGYAWKEI